MAFPCGRSGDGRGWREPIPPAGREEGAPEAFRQDSLPLSSRRLRRIPVPPGLPQPFPGPQEETQAQEEGQVGGGAHPCVFSPCLFGAGDCSSPADSLLRRCRSSSAARGVCRRREDGQTWCALQACGVPHDSSY